ncbi:DUF192 domain-containing protein [Alteribacillus sp. YIM 98480]|uniref:DUF192 domain-containing protein n=1 Tax=Alteribacillus sp. YIM 98480 TaxID=2606599 RepID=UPI00131E205E|nr:DUF192 domain-containing protein [Alteribacillus sp. YIM 98480]
MKLLNLHTNQMVAEEVKGAYAFVKRLKGLMFTKQIPENFALHIAPCPSIHTFFMKYPIDVLYLNNRHEIVGMEEEVAPGKFGKRFRGTRSVVELPSGKIKTSNVKVGQILAFVEDIDKQVS